MPTISTQTGGDNVDESFDNRNKYVAVVYHQILGSYQNGTTPQYQVDLVESTPSTQQKLAVEQMLAEIPDYFFFSILSLVLFVPFGLVAMDKTLEVRRARENGDIARAREASTWSIQYTLCAVMTGPTLAALMLLILVLPIH